MAHRKHPLCRIGDRLTDRRARQWRPLRIGCQRPVWLLCGASSWHFATPRQHCATAAVDAVCHRRAAGCIRCSIATRSASMTPTSAGLLAMTLSFVVMAAAAVWYVAPWLKVADWATGLTRLL